jgi:pimeloyl-ACP methyl ester carboxylesterase
MGNGREHDDLRWTTRLQQFEQQLGEQKVAEVADGDGHVLAGYSQGAAVAAFMAWDGLLDAVGLILVAPPIIRSRVWDPQVDWPVPTYMVVGEHDHSLPDCIER